MKSFFSHFSMLTRARKQPPRWGRIPRAPTLSSSLRILFLNRSYYPDVEATGQLLTELCEDLAKDHEVTVVAGQPNFSADQGKTDSIQDERHNRVRIVRVGNFKFTKNNFLGRAMGLLTYLVLATWAALTVRPRPSIIVVETDPPFLGALGVLLSRWHRCPLVYYLQDLYPEVGLAMGYFRPGMLTWTLRQATQIGFRKADRVVVLGEDMRQRVLDRGIDSAKIVVIPNWVDAAALRPVKEKNGLRDKWQLDGQFVVMYSGNMGLSQNLENILEAARLLQNEPITFLFVGEGASKRTLMAKASAWSLANVRFLPYQPKELLGESLSAADLHLVPLRPGLAGSVVPSKLYGILAAGVPFLAAVDSHSEIARVANSSGAGLVLPPNSANGMAEAIRWCHQNPQELQRMGKRGRHQAETVFNRSISTGRFEEVLGTIVYRAVARREKGRGPEKLTLPTPSLVTS